MALVEALAIDDFERLPYALAKNHELVDGELVDVRKRALSTAAHKRSGCLPSTIAKPIA
jgi:hypothetical protein